MTIRIADICIYPVKSLGGIRLAEAEVTERGLRLDRRWMLIDEAGKFITQRDYPAMATLAVFVMADTNSLIVTKLDGQSLTVLAPQGGEAIEVSVFKSTMPALWIGHEADQFFSDYLGTACHLVYMPDTTRRQVSQKYAGPEHIVSFADGYPLLLANTASLEQLNSRLPAPVPMDRFRANVVVEGAEAFAEDNWGRFKIGSAVFEAVKPCGRCIITTIDQATGQKTGKEPLKTLASFRNSEKGVRFGENLIVIEPGKIEVGDELEFLAPRGQYPHPLESII